MNLKKKRDKCFFAACLALLLIVSGCTSKNHTEERNAEQEQVCEQETEQELKYETVTEQDAEQEAALGKSGSVLIYALCLIAVAAGASGVTYTLLKNDNRTASVIKREAVLVGDTSEEEAAVPVQPVQHIVQYDTKVGFDVFEYTSRGGRENNEDCVGSWHNEYGGIFVTADGLGGHRYGEMASLKAVETVINGWDASCEDIPAQLERKITEANNNIIELQKEFNVTMKTTVAAFAIRGRKAVWANSGDSRVYFIHGNELHSCTNDHSVAFKKYKAGEITREQICTDEDQSSLLRTLGNKDRYKPELYEADVEVCSGDAFLLCTDGAWEYLLDEEILIDFLKSETSQQWSELLMLRVMERINGENDNISLLTVIIK